MRREGERREDSIQPRMKHGLNTDGQINHSADLRRRLRVGGCASDDNRAPQTLWRAFRQQKSVCHGIENLCFIRVPSVAPRTLLRPDHLCSSCKTNPNDGRGRNREPLFFRRKTNISSLRDPGVETCFCETNPNRELQDTWLQDIAKKHRRGDRTKRSQIGQGEPGP